MAFSTIEEEDAVITALADSARVEVDVIGESVEGRPIRLLRIGIPPPAATARAVLLCTGAVHGDEPAGREGLLEWAQELVDEDDEDIEQFLTDHGVWIIPTVNPDGIALGTRRNAADVDIARDCVILAQPESQALAAVIGASRPLVHLDQHEADPQTSTNVTFLHPTLGAAPPIPVARSQDLIVDLKARMTTEGWSSGDYVGLDLENVPRNASSLRHSAGTLVETSVGGAGQTEEVRTAQQLACAQETLTHCIDNVATMLTEVATSEADVAAEGAAGTEPFDLRVTTLDPPPLGYRLTGLVPTTHLAAFNVTVSAGLVVRMDQAAQRAIPFLLDALSDSNVSLGIRLFTLDAPAVVATVEELAPIVAGSHDVVVEARVLVDFVTGLNPVGVPLPVESGDVQFDGTADVFATLELETVGVDEATGWSWFPLRPTDLLAPYGNEVFVRRGVDIGSEVLWSPLGYFRIETVEQTGRTDAPIRLTGQDRMAGLIEAKVTRPRVYAATVQAAALFADLVGDVYPGAAVVFDDESAFEPIGRQLIVDEGRYEPLREIADGFGKVMFWDGEGLLRVEDMPPDDEPVLRLAAGVGGVLIDAGRRLTRPPFNGVIIHGEGGGTDTPVTGVAIDNGPKSPTRWGGRFGRVPHTETLATVRTQAQATMAAREMLRRNLGAPYSVDFTAVPNPGLRPWMPILAVADDGGQEVHVVQTLTMPLLADGEMTGTTRERTHVVIGSVIT